MSGLASRVPAAAALFAGIGWLTTVAAIVAATALRIADPAPIVPNNLGFGDTARVGFAVLAIAFATVGSLLTVKRPANAIGWCMVVIGVAHALGGLAGTVTYSAVAVGTASAMHLAEVSAWLTALSISAGEMLFAIALIFPTGRGHTIRWDRFVRILCVAGPIVLVLFVLQPGPLDFFPSLRNPFGIGPDLRGAVGSPFSPLLGAMFAITLPAMAWSLVSRYRQADEIERQQIKWFALAVLGSVGCLALAATWAFVSDTPPEIAVAMFGFAGALVPIAIGIAITRYRLYEIDRIISRTLSWAVVTGILLITFTVLVIGLQSVLAGVTQGQTLAVATSTLAAFALFQPVRQRVQRVVDRRFDRVRYDGDGAAAAFAERLRSEVDLDAVASDLTGSVEDALRPSAMTLWLKGPAR